MPARFSAASGLGLLCHHSPLEPRSHHCRPAKVLIIDDYLQWSNLAYVAVSRVEHLSQLEQVVCPPEEDSGEARGEPADVTAQQLRKVIHRKLVAYKRQDATKGLRFNLRPYPWTQGGPIEPLLCVQHRAALGLQAKGQQKFSVYRLDKPCVTSAVTPG